MKNSELLQKVRGSIVGGLVGDALGGPMEGMTADFIRALNGGLVTEMLDYDTRPDDFPKPRKPGGYAWYLAPGTHTGGTYFAGLLARCIAQKGGRITCDDLAEFWLKHCNPRYYDWQSFFFSCEKLACTHIIARDLGKGNISDSGSAMCIGPIGVVNACNPRQAALDAYDVASLTHWGCARDAAGIIAAAVAEAMEPKATVDSIARASIDHIPGGRQSGMYAPMRLAVSLAQKAKDTEELTRLYSEQLLTPWTGRGKAPAGDGRHGEGRDPRETVPCAIGMFVNAGGDFVKAVAGAANFGRNSSAIACMTGYIAGVFGGFSTIPGAWVEACLAGNPESPDFEKLSEDLTEALIRQQEKDLSRCRMMASLI